MKKPSKESIVKRGNESLIVSCSEKVGAIVTEISRAIEGKPTAHAFEALELTIAGLVKLNAVQGYEEKIIDDFCVSLKKSIKQIEVVNDE